ncbi:MAG: hypothetical protein LQ346_002650 [Caloplaca aetnensis]|nr:MAG: hypothetical protein LQ346_002650 [Caloplaca aetnensis]
MGETLTEKSDVPINGSSGSPPEDIESPAPREIEKTSEVERQIHGVKWFLTVADIQPNIILSLGEFGKFPWLATAYAIPGTVLVLIQSKLYGLFNVKWLYLGFVVLFEIGSAISGAAPTMNALIVGRMIAGVGGCGMYVGSLTFFSVVTTPKERPMYISLITPVWGIGTVLGPIVGGALAESSVGWRWGFYINLFIFVAAAPVMLFLLPSLNFEPSLSAKQKLAKLDWLGLLILTGWSISFFMALIFGGTLYKWDSYSEIILWVFVGVLTIAFVLVHKTHPFVPIEDRLYPGHMLRNWRLGILQVAIFSAPAAVYIPIYYIPLFFQFARGESPVEAAVRLLPFVLVVATVSILNGVLMSKLGYYMPWFLGGSLLAVIGGALMYTVDTETTSSAIYGYTVLLGIGGGCLLMSAFGCVSAVVDASDVFNAIGVLSLVQCMGTTFFPAISGCIFQNLGVVYIRPYLPPDFTGKPTVILAGASRPEFQGLSEDLQAQIARAIISAMSNLYTMTIAVSGITAILSPFLGVSVTYSFGSLD